MTKVDDISLPVAFINLQFCLQKLQQVDHL